VNVREMIESMKYLGIGEVYTDEESERISLSYLNLANEQLYRETANLNDDILEDVTIISVAGNTSVELPKIPFLISEIYRNGYDYQMEEFSKSNFDKYKRQNLLSGNPIIYTSKGSTINFYPIIAEASYTFNVSYIPKITRLLISTPEIDVPYPAEYHSVLVDGALYYLFQDESGFKNISKENEAKIRWSNGKAALQSYLYGKNKKQINTFQSA